MRSKLTRKPRIQTVQVGRLVSYQLETYRALFAYCNSCLKALAKPCLRLARRRRSARQKSIAIALLNSLRQTRALRVHAVREHLRTLRAGYEQSLFWLHSADPYTA
jgi:hypothetical protein